MPNPFVYPVHPLARGPAFPRVGPANDLRGILLVAVPPIRRAPVPPGINWPENAAVSHAAGAGGGAVLCDETGQLFERIGDYVRPLGPLSPLAFDPDRHAPAEDGATTPADAPPARLRPLLPEPGRPCVVALGDFKPLLVSRLGHPERLRDGHRMACHVQVYEATAPVRFGSVADLGLLCPLTPAIASRLGVGDLLGQPLRRPLRPAPDVVVPGERLFALKPIDDPTLANPPRPPAPPAPLPAAPPPETVSAPRATIPERFVKPWEMRLTREEALDTIDRGHGLLRRLVESLGSRGRRRDIRRWQVTLSGHSADEQLWGIEPPRGGLRSPLVREWARHTLRLAGYDPRSMLLEWEVFWRRKGV